MKLIFDYNLNGFDLMEFEFIEEEVTFEEHCFQGTTNWNHKNSTMLQVWKV